MCVVCKLSLEFYLKNWSSHVLYPNVLALAFNNIAFLPSKLTWEVKVMFPGMGLYLLTVVLLFAVEQGLHLDVDIYY